MTELTSSFNSGGFVFYDEHFIHDADKKTLMEELVNMGNTLFCRGDTLRVRGGLSMSGAEVLVSERTTLPVPGVSWYGTPVEKLASDLTILLKKKKMIPDESRVNYCLFNMYETSRDSIAFHSDSEYNSFPIIASLTLGYPRKFLFLEKETNDTIEMKLANGSLLIFGGNINKDYMHSVPPCKALKGVDQRRINLTFRIVFPITSVTPGTLVKTSNRFNLGREEVNGFRRAFFCDDFWFITPEEALLNDECFMLKNWGTAGTLTSDPSVLHQKISKMRGKKDEIMGSSDWFILTNVLELDQLREKLEKVSVYMLWKYPQLPSLRPRQIKVNQFYTLYMETPEPGEPRRHTVLV